MVLEGGLGWGRGLDTLSYIIRREIMSLHTVEPIYSGHHWGMKLYRGVALSQGLICTKKLTQQNGLYRGVSSWVGWAL